MQQTFLGVAWAMALVTSIVLLVLSAGAVVIAMTAPTSSTPQLDAWRTALICIVMLVAATTLLAGLTVARLRRGEALVVVEPAVAEPLPAVVVVDAEPVVRAD